MANTAPSARPERSGPSDQATRDTSRAGVSLPAFLPTFFLAFGFVLLNVYGAFFG